jgi:hypothetical protein
VEDALNLARSLDFSRIGSFVKPTANWFYVASLGLRCVRQISARPVMVQRVLARLRRAVATVLISAIANSPLSAELKGPKLTASGVSRAWLVALSP